MFSGGGEVIPSRRHSAILTPREVEVLQLTSEGLPNPQIGNTSSTEGIQGQHAKAPGDARHDHACAIGSGLRELSSYKLWVGRSSRKLMVEMVSLMAISGRLMRDDQMASNS
jgi:hypothetical protein